MTSQQKAMIEVAFYVAMGALVWMLFGVVASFLNWEWVLMSQGSLAFLRLCLLIGAINGLVRAYWIIKYGK